jgi:hypothetical protein
LQILVFFAIQRLCAIARFHDKESKRVGKRYFVSRIQANTKFYNRHGHCIELKGILPQKVGQVREIGVVLGKKKGVPVRLILLKVPEEVAKERQKRMREKCQNSWKCS